MAETTTLDRAFTLSAHNVYASRANGYWYADQYATLEEVVRAGAHWLSLDVYWDSSLSTVVIRHGSQAVDRLQRPFGAKLLLVDCLERVRALLAGDSSLILVIDLEDYVPLGGSEGIALRDIFSETVGEYILNAPPGGTRATWPTLGEMRASGKRLVLLSQKREDGIFHKYFDYTWSTLYGTLCLPKQIEQLDTNKTSEPAPGVFALVPNFPSVPLLRRWEHINTCHLRRVLKLFTRKYPGVTPNAVSLNFVGKGNPRRVIDAYFPGLVWF